MKCYINCPYEEKEEAKRLGARWDPKEKSWYFDDAIYKSETFKKWLPISVSLPDLSANIDEPYKPRYGKYFLLEARGVKATIYCSEIDEAGFEFNWVFGIEKEWACSMCNEDDLYEYLGDDEEYSDEEYECAIEKCKLKHANDEDCYDIPKEVDNQGIDRYVEFQATIGDRRKYTYQYLGQFKDLDECRAYLAAYKITG